MTPILPDRGAAIRKGWKYQVQWIEDGLPCFVRCQTWGRVEELIIKMREHNPVVFMLTDLLRIH